MSERIDLAAIERLGEYASDCRWSADDGLSVVVRGLDGAEYPEIATAVRAADAEWIAFFDPPTIRRIVDELHVARELIHAVGLDHILADAMDVHNQDTGAPS